MLIGVSLIEILDTQAHTLLERKDGGRWLGRSMLAVVKATKVPSLRFDGQAGV